MNDKAMLLDMDMLHDISYRQIYVIYPIKYAHAFFCGLSLLFY